MQTNILILNRWNRILLTALPLLLLLAGMLRLPHAGAETPGNCPTTVGTPSCGDTCFYQGRVFAKTECATSGTDGCCRYVGYNVRCMPYFPYPESSCPSHYFLELDSSKPNYRCVSDGESVSCVAVGSSGETD